MRSYTYRPIDAYTGGNSTSSKETFVQTSNSYHEGYVSGNSSSQNNTSNGISIISRNDDYNALATTAHSDYSYSGSSRTTGGTGTAAFTNTSSGSGSLYGSSTNQVTVGDTSFSASGSTVGGYRDAAGTVVVSSSSATSTSESSSRTFIGGSTTTKTEEATLSNLGAIRNNTAGAYLATITTSYSINSTLSSWTVTTTSVANPTELSVWNPDSTDGGYSPLTYIDSYQSPITATTIGGTYVVYSYTLTNNVFSPLEDTVFHLDAGIAAEEYMHPVALWTYKAVGMVTGTSTQGRFTELFSSVGSRTYTMQDYQVFTTSSEQASLSTVSRYTTTVTASSMAGTSTSTYNTTVFEWNLNGTSSNFDFLASSNNSTSTVSFTVAGVGSSLSVEGEDTLTVHTHQVQLTGYSEFSFTTGTTAALWFGEVSRTIPYTVWYASRTRQDTILSRYTTADTILIDKYSTVGAGGDTSAVLLGQVTTTSSLFYTGTVTTTVPQWPSHLNRLVTEYQIVSSSNFAITSLSSSAGGNSTYGVTNSMTVRYYTSDRVLPVVGTLSNTKQMLSPMNSFIGAAYRVSARPNGYVGWGGGHTVNQSLNVYVTVTANLMSGEEFTEFPFNASYLKTKLMHPNLTVFPVQTGFDFTLPNAERARYVSTVSGLTGAQVDVTWTKLSAGTVTIKGNVFSIPITLSKAARYSVEPQGLISGDFLYEGVVASSGFGCPYPDVPWSISLGGYGRVTWSAYPEGQTTPITSVFDMPEAYTTFTLASNVAVAYIGEPLLTASLHVGDYGNHYSIRTQYQ